MCIIRLKSNKNKFGKCVNGFLNTYLMKILNFRIIPTASKTDSSTSINSTYIIQVGTYL